MTVSLCAHTVGQKVGHFEWQGFPGGLDGKDLPAMQETQVQSLGQEDPLEKGMTTHSSIPAWRIPWTEEPGELQCMGSQESDTSAQLNYHQRICGPHLLASGWTVSRELAQGLTPLCEESRKNWLGD